MPRLPHEDTDRGLTAGRAIFLRRNINPVKHFQRLVHISLIDDAFRKCECLGLKVLQGVFPGVGALGQLAADGRGITAKALGDLSLSETGIGQLVEQEGFTDIETGAIGACRRIGRRRQEMRVSLQAHRRHTSQRKGGNSLIAPPGRPLVGG